MLRFSRISNRNKLSLLYTKTFKISTLIRQIFSFSSYFGYSSPTRKNLAREILRLRRVASSDIFLSAAVRSSRSVFYVIGALSYDIKKPAAISVLSDMKQPVLILFRIILLYWVRQFLPNAENCISCYLDFILEVYFCTIVNAGEQLLHGSRVNGSWIGTGTSIAYRTLCDTINLF